MERILACVDLSAVTARILRRASHLAARTNAELFVLHVAPAPSWAGHGPDLHSVGDPLARELRSAQQQVQRLTDDLSGDDSLRVSALTIRGAPAEVILAQAEALDAALLVLGAYHRGVFHELFVGSVARNVLRRTSRPVLVVPEMRA